MWAIKLYLVLLGVSQGSFWTIHVRVHEERMAVIRLPSALNRAIDSGRAPPIVPMALIFPNVSLEPDNNLENKTEVLPGQEPDAEIIIKPLPSPPEIKDFEGGIMVEEISADFVIEKSDDDEEDPSEEDDSSEESKEDILGKEVHRRGNTLKHVSGEFDDLMEDDDGEDDEDEDDTADLQEIKEILDEIDETMDIISIAEKYVQIAQGDSEEKTSEAPIDFNTVGEHDGVKAPESTPIASTRTLESTSLKPTPISMEPMLATEIMDNSIVTIRRSLVGHEKKEAPMMEVFYSNGHDEIKSFFVGIIMTSGFCILVALMWKVSKRRQQLMASECGLKV